MFRIVVNPCRLQFFRVPEPLETEREKKLRFLGHNKVLMRGCYGYLNDVTVKGFVLAVNYNKRTAGYVQDRILTRPHKTRVSRSHTRNYA